MPLWKLNFIPFGFAHVPFWVLAEDQALERPPLAPPVEVPVAVAPAAPRKPRDIDSAPSPRADGLKRFIDRFVDALVRFGDRSYEAKVRSGRLNRYYY